MGSCIFILRFLRRRPSFPAGEFRYRHGAEPTPKTVESGEKGSCRSAGSATRSVGGRQQNWVSSGGKLRLRSSGLPRSVAVNYVNVGVFRTQ
ncbi:hypothetical protein B296_00038601 [Ensete ventricosum]|uniref:Uncharacterized protein n=1 Tax=Ensete ventricosum TaxID=4639 RepID=A0A426Y8J3_ENSVE|nr:hypothetical protein B296_00038601 [Ensete ventricosum]